MQTSTIEKSPPGWKRTFFTIWVGQAFSLFGSILVDFALVWYLTKTTGSATVLAMATLVVILPGVILGPIAGAVVDRTNRRVVMILADSLNAVAILFLVYSFWMGWAQIWHIYIVMGIRSINGGFQWPAFQASTSLMVPERHLARVAGINETLRGGLTIVAPPWEPYY